MRKLKLILTGLFFGLLLGLWFGVNIGKEHPIFSNPFAERSIQQQLKQSGGMILEKSGEALEKGGKALKETMQAPATE